MLCNSHIVIGRAAASVVGAVVVAVWSLIHWLQQFCCILPWIAAVLLYPAMDCSSSAVSCHGLQQFCCILPWIAAVLLYPAMDCSSSAVSCHGLQQFCCILPWIAAVLLYLAMDCSSSAVSCHGFQQFCCILPWIAAVLLYPAMDCSSSAVSCHGLQQFCCILPWIAAVLLYLAVDPIIYSSYYISSLILIFHSCFMVFRRRTWLYNWSHVDTGRSSCHLCCSGGCGSNPQTKRTQCLFSKVLKTMIMCCWLSVCNMPWSCMPFVFDPYE